VTAHPADSEPNKVAAAPRAPLRETGVAQVMTSTRFGKHPTAFTATGLPILRLALDVHSMDPALTPLLTALDSSLAGRPPRLAYARLLAYKKGNRGIISYSFEDAGGAVLTVLGKLYPQPTQVTRVHSLLDALYRQAFADRPGLEVPRPLGTVLDLSMLVYLPVEGTPLDEVLSGPRAVQAIRRTAAWLDALHAAPLSLDRKLQPATEVVNLQAWAALVGQTHPTEGARAARLASDLEATASRLPMTGETVIHKDFHYKHVLVDEVDLGVRVIDFDEVRLGDPMYDVAHFSAHLRLLACRNPRDAGSIAALEGTFLDAYTEQSGRALGHSFFWYATYTCLKIAKQLCTVRGVRPRPDDEEQLRQLTAILDQGLAFRDLLQ
jgi:hypothetical protein